MLSEEQWDQFWAKVDKSGHCWEWTAFKSEKGYGKFTLRSEGKKRTLRVHRISYEAANGPIPDGLFVDHTCFNRACVNPSHLRAVTNKQNLENRAGSYSNTGVRNVYYIREGEPYLMVQVKHNQEIHRRYGFSTVEEAAEAARQLRLSLFTHNDADRSVTSS